MRGSGELATGSSVLGGLAAELSILAAVVVILVALAIVLRVRASGNRMPGRRRFLRLVRRARRPLIAFDRDLEPR